MLATVEDEAHLLGSTCYIWWVRAFMTQGSRQAGRARARADVALSLQADQICTKLLLVGVVVVVLASTCCIGGQRRGQEEGRPSR